MDRTSALDAAPRYSAAGRVLHWLVVLFVLVVLPFGAVIKFVKEDVKLTFYMIHESLGFLVLWIMLARLAVRLVKKPPPPLPMPAWEHRLAATVHWALYAALILMPITGFLATNAFGFPLRWFNLVPIPSPIGKSDAAPYIMAVHVTLAYTILVLIGLHLLGVLQHHILRRDGTLYRML
ncbi:cytochrome b [Propylenella binzhouense]|uniref:Cytochrome b n=1 Tax=Propylenella binzhouense TaxID=2555902 RepID=A0A964T716_9HYPH|nr:cytochrome b/b6 domain-containing protein [Propylenella binzhouense]MYZ49688.1 cytochrome b [Propylenella binzhouense]